MRVEKWRKTHSIRVDRGVNMVNKDIKVLLKFGERKYIQDLINGDFYFSNAKKFRDIEVGQKNKGQGDILEGGSYVYAVDGQIYNNNDTALLKTIENQDILIHYAPANNIPVYCMFACDYDHICRIDENHIRVILSDDEKEDMRKHFAKADAVVVFANPQCLMNDFYKSLGETVKSDLVHYFQVSGIKEDGKVPHLDLSYYEYLTKDVPPEEIDGAKKYVFLEEYVYRSLFCKDMFFKNQQEYRIVLSDNRIEEPQVFHIDLSVKPKIFDLDMILNGDILEI